MGEHVFASAPAVAVSRVLSSAALPRHKCTSLSESLNGKIPKPPSSVHII